MYRKRCLWIALTLLISLSGLSGLGQASNKGMHVRFSLATDPVTVTASGTVTDKQTGAPIAGALVRAHITAHQFSGPDWFELCPQDQTLTDDKGRYTLQIETPLTTTGAFKGKDSLCLYASAAGYETLPQYIKPAITAETTEFDDCDFALGAGRRLSGILEDSNGQPVAEALVRVQNGWNGDWNFFGALGLATANERGEFELWIASEPTNDLTRNPWLTILKRGQGALFVWDILQKDDLGTLTLPACGTITGRVVDGQGDPLANCEVSVRGYPCGLIGKTQTDADGQYVLQGVPGEPSIVDFYTAKNGHFIDAWGTVTVHARLNPEVDLKDAANYKLRTRDNETSVADDMMVGEDTGVSGRLIASASSLGLGGLMVRLDTSWAMMVEADIEGNFHFPRVAPGQHKLTVYLPHNLRYDRGIGRTTINATPGVPLTDVEIQLEELAELRVQYLDAQGNPLPGVTASATWSKDGGAWTEGTVSDADGWAVLYLYPDDSQYIGGWDRSSRLVAETTAKMKPSPAEIMEPTQVVMVEAATLAGRLLDEKDSPIAGERFTGRLAYADGTVTERQIATDENGDFTLPRIVPGVVELALDTESLLYKNVVGRVFEIEPGKTLELEGISLVGGIDKAAAIEQFFARAVADPTELLAAARQLLEAVQSADYTKPNAWRDFIDPEYCVYTNYPAWVQWICTNLKANPIETIELGDVSRSQSKGFWKSHQNVPAIDYQLTLRDGTVLKGTLLFDYNPDKTYWMGMHGLDWHLNDPFN
jgi:Carboxypeptidase regulatory-like domain